MALIVGVLASGCSGDDCANGSCLSPDGGDASSDAADAGSDVVVPQNCDLGADITASPACIDDGIGVFVDATNGNDTGLGTKASPFKTIAKALGAVGAKPRIYVCAGTYAEDVSLTQTNAVGIFGGLKCADWTYDGSQPVVGKSSLALHADGVTKPIVISDVTFQAAAGANAGDSSIAALVNASTDVTLRRVKLRPGAGKDGAAGTTGANWTTVAQDDPSIAGKSASGATGGADHACSICMDSVNSTGGGGGNGGLAGATGGNNGKPNLSANAPDDGAGGASGCKAGDNGANASAATAAPGAAVVGKLTTAGWVPTPGSDGPNGGPGQGGGGGGGTNLAINSGAGAGGGCGGCGGAGGKGGGGGGASIGLAVSASKVTLVACDIVTLAGGAGGAGSSGQDGQLGGYAGTANGGCAGGVGGTGATGGAGGGGAGGSSVGVLYAGNKPAIDQATNIVVPASPATKGAGGAAGVNDGIDGVAQATFQASTN
ncbi:MAG TPA: hypothetical protein VGH28_06445 [Polyangiaceae bacterium]